MTLAKVQIGTGTGAISSGTAGNVLNANCAVGNTVLIFLATESSAQNDVTAMTSPMGTCIPLGSIYGNVDVWCILKTTGAGKAITPTCGHSWFGVAMEVSGGPYAAVLSGAAIGNSTSPAVSIYAGPGDFVATVLTSDNALTAPGGWSDGGWAASSGYDFAYLVNGASAANLTATWSQSSGHWYILGVRLIAQAAPQGVYVKQAYSGPVFSNSGTTQKILDVPCLVGSYVIAYIATNQTGANSVTAVSSPMGTFTRLGSYTNGGTETDMEIWVCPSAASAGQTITATVPGGGAVYTSQGLEITGPVSAVNWQTPVTALGGTSMTFAVSYGAIDSAWVCGISDVPTSAPANPFVAFDGYFGLGVYGNNTWALSQGNDAAFATAGNSAMTATWPAASGRLNVVGVQILGGASADNFLPFC
jgi:hypothetical protein